MDNPVFDIALGHFMIVSLLLAAAGVATMLTKRNAIGILIGVELLINAAAVNMVAFNRFSWGGTVENPVIDGMVFTMFVIVLAAAEAAIALAIFLNFYNNFSSIDVERADEMRG
jgi:NADH-quinone oxidoreductase subunit K